MAVQNAWADQSLRFRPSVRPTVSGTRSRRRVRICRERRAGVGLPHPAMAIEDAAARPLDLLKTGWNAELIGTVATFCTELS